MLKAKRMYFAGIDIGSTMTKVVIADEEETLVSYVIKPTLPEQRRLANKTMEDVLAKSNLKLEQISYVIATGYGRFNVPFADRQISELSCHARGVSTLFPSAKVVIDIGGQDAKGFKVKDGNLEDFVMNDKCAAGTGRFLEVIASMLGLCVEDLGEISMNSTNKIIISNICTIFARLEIISRLSEGAAIQDIVAGINDSLSNRIARMVMRLKIEPDVILTGGVARNIGVVRSLEGYLNQKVIVPEEPLLTGALGAALLGKIFFLRTLAKGESVPLKERHLKEITLFNGE